MTAADIFSSTVETDHVINGALSPNIRASPPFFAPPPEMDADGHGGPPHSERVARPTPREWPAPLRESGPPHSERVARPTPREWPAPLRESGPPSSREWPAHSSSRSGAGLCARQR